MHEKAPGRANLRTAIVEDEQHCRNALLSLIADECSELRVVATSESV